MALTGLYGDENLHTWFILSRRFTCATLSRTGRVLCVSVYERTVIVRQGLPSFAHSVGFRCGTFAARIPLMRRS